MTDLTLDQVLRAIRLSWEHPDLTFSYDVHHGWQIHTGALDIDFDATPLSADGYDGNDRRRTANLKPCGTRSAAQRHRRLGEPLDAPCLAADAAYARDLYRRRRAQAEDNPADAPILTTPTGAPMLVSVAGQQKPDDSFRIASTSVTTQIDCPTRREGLAS